MTLRKLTGLWWGGLFFFVSGVHGQTISGSLIDALTKYPVSSAKVTIVELNMEYISDSSGNYKTDTLPKGTYTVRFESQRYLKQNKTVRLIDAKGQTGITNITLDVLMFSIASEADQTKGQMEVGYFFPNHADVTIEVCDAGGKTVRTVYDRSHQGGMRKFLWDGTDNMGKILPLGTYTCKFKSGNLFTCRTLNWRGVEKR